MARPRNPNPLDPRIHLSLRAPTLKRLDALVDMRPELNRTSVIANMIYDAYEKLSPAHRARIESKWPDDGTIPITYVSPATQNGPWRDDTPTSDGTLPELDAMLDAHDKSS